MTFYSDNLSSNCSENNYVVKQNETQWNSERLPIKESQFPHQHLEYWIYVQPWQLKARKVQNLKSFLHCFCMKRATFCRAQRYSLKTYQYLRISYQFISTSQIVDLAFPVLTTISSQAVVTSSCWLRLVWCKKCFHCTFVKYTNFKISVKI